MSEEKIIPRHVGYIVDGNRRWAKKHGLPGYEGHLAGYNTLKDILRYTVDAGVKYVSLYAFSTENWKRGEGETGKLMKLALRLFKTDLNELIEEDIRLKVLGTAEGLSSEVLEAARKAEEATAQCKKATVALCFNYGGQREIVDAVRKLIVQGKNAEEINEKEIAKNLYAPEIPEVDIVVRTSGEERLSNFMLWRVAYSEMFFLEKYWPDMTKEDVEIIIDEYQKRSRRFGG
ncbi:di-trans,poly-cis-decaprenylcistransferase [Candidatus Saccharibacteria bacterium]|nr:di-trans,poly-cis-decaprenylcistransferase [Candidatus Saccharibacteria bacterium]